MFKIQVNFIILEINLKAQFSQLWQLIKFKKNFNNNNLNKKNLKLIKLNNLILDKLDKMIQTFKKNLLHTKLLLENNQK